MIKSFEIINFRCFRSTKGKGFGRINLFGGKNNAGKTALLEALLLMGNPSNHNITQLLGFRGISQKFIRQVPERIWNNMFYQQKKENDIFFRFNLEEKNDNQVKISYDEESDYFAQTTQAEYNSILGNEVVKSLLHISTTIKDKDIQTNSLIVHTGGITGSDKPIKLINANFFSANGRLTPNELTTAFDKAKLEGRGDSLLKAFQIIDKSIEKVETLNIGDAALYLKRKDENYTPLSLFGDAMRKIAHFVLMIINNENSILLIDEIENGIHYENHREVWKMIFDLCIKFNVQLFATTHSGEMIEAFKDTILANDDYQNEGKYFEMLRHSVSDEIIIQKIPIDSLENRIKNKRPIRGESFNSGKK